MATDNASESLPDQLSSIPRIDETAYQLRTSTDALLGVLRNQGMSFNPGDRVPLDVVLEACRLEIGAGRAWPVYPLTRVT